MASLLTDEQRERLTKGASDIYQFVRKTEGDRAAAYEVFLWLMEQAGFADPAYSNLSPDQQNVLIDKIVEAFTTAETENRPLSLDIMR